MQSKNLDKKSNIWIPGSKGMVSSALIRRLQELKTFNILSTTKEELNLIDSEKVDHYLMKNKIDVIVLSAGKVGGIHANSKYPASFLYENIMICSNVIHLAKKHNIEKLLFLGSSCIYPKFAEQPIKEDYLLTGALELTNQSYAIAKIAGIKLCDSYREQYGVNYISAMPTNLYGPNDNFDLESSHVIPALLRKCHLAKVNKLKEFEVWGSGNALREFLHVNDLADALIFLLNNYNDAGPINVGYGSDISIKELANLLCEIVGYNGKIIFNTSMPDGTPKKLLDSTKINNLGWRPKISLDQGLKQTYDWYLENYI